MFQAILIVTGTVLGIISTILVSRANLAPLVLVPFRSEASAAELATHQRTEAEQQQAIEAMQAQVESIYAKVLALETEVGLLRKGHEQDALEIARLTAQHETDVEIIAKLRTERETMQRNIRELRARVKSLEAVIDQLPKKLQEDRT